MKLLLGRPGCELGNWGSLVLPFYRLCSEHEGDCQRQKTLSRISQALQAGFCVNCCLGPVQLCVFMEVAQADSYMDRATLQVFRISF